MTTIGHGVASKWEQLDIRPGMTKRELLAAMKGFPDHAEIHLVDDVITKATLVNKLDSLPDELNITGFVRVGRLPVKVAEGKLTQTEDLGRIQ